MPTTQSRPHNRPTPSSALMGSPRLQTIQVQESLRDTYAQTKQALQSTSGSPNDIDGMGFRLATSGELCASIYIHLNNFLLVNYLNIKMFLW